ncbi:DNA-binding transcriptional MocR family regulator [Bacillus oleivorans]|uniref:DNA-binding transcriptional MocR family regulator n=2 Tax=Bacillus oleivorans TaxID=1448271 RepID=A0A285CYX2_9BACI|nr:DNA-binding transcriptional MocR family regulator [Bacillus oleivorans]
MEKMRKYEEIIMSIEKRVEQGLLDSGSKLPSIRTLSEELSCSKNTVIKAYEEMEKNHLIYSVPKSGYYVVEGNPFRKKRNSKVDKIDFLSAGPDPKSMPYLDFKHCINQAIEKYKEDMFIYSDIQGLYSLRLELARHLQDLQVFSVPERICVVTGSQQALHLLISLPFPNRKKNICVEQPTHPSMIESLKFQNVNTIGIEINKEGIDFKQLEDIFKHQDIKLFYTVSRFQNPTGYSYSNTEKKKLVELAQKYDVYIIEDDYMGDLDPNLKQDPMFAFDPSGRIIYTKSFSKVLFPGLRLGLAVLPEALIPLFLQAKFAADVHTPVLTQGALEIFLKSGMYDAHIKKMRDMYRRKGMLIQKAFREHLPTSVSYSKMVSGFYSTLELPRPLKAKQVIERLKEENLFVDDVGKMFLPEYQKDNMLRLSVSHVEEDLIDIGVRKLADVIRSLL